MIDISTFAMDIDDPDAPWNHDPVEFLPEVIAPGRIAIRFWEIREEDQPTAMDFSFTWDGGKEAEWHYDISDENPGQSPGTSSPFWGAASWGSGENVEITYGAGDGPGGEWTLSGVAPNEEMMQRPQTWVSLAQEIASYCDSAR